jgi:hypothetical protein
VQLTDADFDEPDLWVGNASLQLAAGQQLIRIELEDAEIGIARGVLADGSECLIDVYACKFIWDGRESDTLASTNLGNGPS